MNTREKAQELLIKMWSKSSSKLEAKECALIAVNEVVNQYIESYNKMKQRHPYMLEYNESDRYIYWINVKLEIEKL